MAPVCMKRTRDPARSVPRTIRIELITPR